MSGWNPDTNGYAMLSAVEYGRQVTEAERCFDWAMRADNGRSGAASIAGAVRAHRKAIRALETIRYSMETTASPSPSPKGREAV